MTEVDDVPDPSARTSGRSSTVQFESLLDGLGDDRPAADERHHEHDPRRHQADRTCVRSVYRVGGPRGRHRGKTKPTNADMLAARKTRRRSQASPTVPDAESVDG